MKRSAKSALAQDAFGLSTAEDTMEDIAAKLAELVALPG